MKYSSERWKWKETCWKVMGLITESHHMGASWQVELREEEGVGAGGDLVPTNSWNWTLRSSRSAADPTRLIGERREDSVLSMTPPCTNMKIIHQSLSVRGTSQNMVISALMSMNAAPEAEPANRWDGVQDYRAQILWCSVQPPWCGPSQATRASTTCWWRTLWFQRLVSSICMKSFIKQLFVENNWSKPAKMNYLSGLQVTLILWLLF